MTERKPAGMSWESWREELIRLAREEGAFDNLAGAGKPFADLGEGYDPDWWGVDERFLAVEPGEDDAPAPGGLPRLDTQAPRGGPELLDHAREATRRALREHGAGRRSVESQSCRSGHDDLADVHGRCPSPEVRITGPEHLVVGNRTSRRNPG
jgi:hypothetical protein